MLKTNSICDHCDHAKENIAQTAEQISATIVFMQHNKI